MSARFKSLWEREDTGLVQRLEVLMLFSAWVLIAFFGFNNQDPFLQTVSFSLSALFTIVAIIWLYDISNPKNDLVESVGFGKKEDALLGIVFGVIGAIVLTGLFGGSASVVPASSVVGYSVLIVLMAAIVEEAFFRSTFTPTVSRLLRNDWLGVVVGAVVFGLFHIFVYNSVTSIVFLIGLGLTWFLGNHVLKTTTFGYSFHLAYNFIVVGGLYLLM